MTTLDNQTHFEAAPSDLHREDTRDSQLRGVRISLFFLAANRQLERNADACIDEIHAINQSVQGSSDFNLRLQAFHPGCCYREDRRELTLGSTDGVNSFRDCRLVT